MIAACLAPAVSIAASSDALPPFLAPYAVHGHLSLDKMDWLRGSLPDASAGERARWKKIEAWEKSCVARHAAVANAELRRLGIANPNLKAANLNDTDCGFVGDAGYATDGFRSWPQFNAALDEARKRFAPFLYATEIAESGTEPPPTAPLSDRLRGAAVGEQILRGGLTQTSEGGLQPPKWPADAERLRGFVFWLEIEKRDHANTAMLKAVVAKSGWPSIPAVGKKASSDAWLLVQHADDDPAFQLNSLRLMEPLVKRGEVDRKNYAYLYDRVMLKIAGHQRYGTQMTCSKGHWVPMSLEDPAHVDARRKSVGLDTLAKYRVQIEKMDGGSCGR